MIIEVLYNLYKKLLNEKETGILPPNFNYINVSHEIVIDDFGEVVGIIDLRTLEGNSLIARCIPVPEQVNRTRNVLPNFLCDNCSYALGLSAEIKIEAKTKFNSFKDFNIKILRDIDDIGAKAFVKFLEKWNPDTVSKNEIFNISLKEIINSTSAIVFRLKEDSTYIHNRESVLNAWNFYKNAHSSEITGECMITGNVTNIARLHPKIKGVTKSHKSGASFVTFNNPSFESYGKSQGENAPMSEEVTFAYTTALNFLLNNEKNRIDIGDTTIVFWAENNSGITEDFTSELLTFTLFDNSNYISRHKTLNLEKQIYVKDILEKIKYGLPIFNDTGLIDKNTTVYILGLSANISRLRVKFWYIDSFDKILKRVLSHFRNMDIIKGKFDNDYISIEKILRKASYKEDITLLPQKLKDDIFKSVVFGLHYPQDLYIRILQKIRADNADNDYVKVSFIKAYLLRNFGNEVISIGLDKQLTDTGYLLGRLFAVIEEVQIKAYPNINSTIRSKFITSASMYPRLVFQNLLRMANIYINKIEKGKIFDGLIRGIIENFKEIPEYLSLEEQGMFMLGYYHQKNSKNIKEVEINEKYNNGKI